MKGILKMNVVDPREVALDWLERYSSAISSGDVAATVSSFLPDGWLRDVLVFTWDTRSLEGRDKIASYLTGTLPNASIQDIQLDEGPEFKEYLSPSLFSLGPLATGVEFAIKFRTPIAHGRGYARLLQDEVGDWKAMSVAMMMEDLKGHEEGIFESLGHTLSWEEIQSRRRQEVEDDPQVLIVGGGQTGLQIAARFGQMKIRTVLIETNKRIGENWMQRYPTLYLHTPRTANTLLYQPYPQTWPFYTPRSKVADSLEQYAVSQDLVVWINSRMTSKPTYDSNAKRWDVTIDRDGESVKMRPSHIVVAMGSLGPPNMPVPTGAFLGKAIHASEWMGAEPFVGQKVIVVGAGNTAADICQDLTVRGAKSVTMVQRSSTCVVSVHTNTDAILRAYPEGVPVPVSDFKSASLPTGLLKKLSIAEHDYRQAKDRELLQGLEKIGFKYNDGPDDAGAHILALDRYGGHWVDVGTAALLASGKVGLKQGVEVQGFEGNKVIFTDGSQLEADTVIFATGYQYIRPVVWDVFGAETIDRTHDFVGLDQEGELNGCYRPSGHPGLWYATGSFGQSRIGSKSMALLIKASELGLH